MKFVWVELGLDAQPIRIFRTRQASLQAGWRQAYPREVAVGIIRHKIFMRSDGYCEFCGALITEQTMHMHEKQHRGKGGEISLSNSVPICATCHRRAHADRNPRFTKKGNYIDDSRK